MTPFPQLFTGRLLLRKIEVDDVPCLVKYANNKKISDQVLNIPYPYQEPDAVFRISYVVQGFKNKARYVFAIIFRDTEELIGEIGLHLDVNGKIAELGYWVGEPFWGKGIATEAIGAVLTFGFTKTELEQIYASCHVDNRASERVLEKNGMRRNSLKGNVAQWLVSREEHEVRSVQP
jgi:ribosomal-protein-alanine N-acetyltransferase